jgi:drug/metabolite transporter (DMT)-like permease
VPLLLLVSFVWAFSFGLIKGRLGGLDSSFISAVRLGLALLVFVPFFRPRGLTARLALTLAAIGAVQFGLMYLAYNESFKYLPAHEVALFTLTTPIIVTLLADALERTLRLRALLAALLAVAGAGIVISNTVLMASSLAGFGLVQFSNAAFGVGQVFYRRARQSSPSINDRQVFALLYGGGLAVTLPLALARTNFGTLALNQGQVLTLLYLGIIASGLCFFWWNLGATRVGTATLAVFNNTKVPLGVACSLLVFGESANLPRLLIGGALLLAAIALAETKKASEGSQK